MFDLNKIYNRGHHWFGKTPKPNKYFGFIYAIINIKYKKIYIGKKQYKGKRNRKDGSFYFVNNNWEFYTGSCKPLNEDIKIIGKEFFIFIILKNLKSEYELSNEEVSLQIELDVLKSKVEEEYIFYNKNINGLNYRPPEKHKETTIKKFSENMTGDKNPMYGKKHTEEAKRKTGEASKKRGISKETFDKIYETRRLNTKVYEFIHRDGYKFIGTIDMLNKCFVNTKKAGIGELIRGKCRDKTCLSGYSKVHTRYGWISAKFIGVLRDIKELKKKYEN